jgi:hypothetical protein
MEITIPSLVCQSAETLSISDQPVNQFVAHRPVARALTFDEDEVG